MPRKYDPEYYQAHKEQARERQGRYNQKHIERVREARRKYDESHREEIRATQQIYRDTHRDQERAKGKRYHDSHPEKMKEKNKRRYWGDKDGELKRYKEWYAKNRELISQREKMKRASRTEEQIIKDKAIKLSQNQKLRRRVLEHYGMKCVCCGETEYEFLAIDHINGGGNKHRREVGSGTRLYSWLIKNNFPDGFQTLCHNCNMAKGFYGECPHERHRKEVQ